MFEIISPQPLHKIWMPVDANGTSGDTLYVGQIVTTAGDGCVPLGAAAGVANVEDKYNRTINDKLDLGVPFGVVTGTNMKTPNTVNATYNVEYITSEHTDNANFTNEKALHEGIGVEKSEKCAMVQIGLIFPHTILKGPIYNATYGTSLSTISLTTGSSDGLSIICATGQAWGANALADLRTVYCSKGANQGIYRISDDATSSALTFDSPWPYDPASGDEFRAVNLRRGVSFAQFDSESMCILQSCTTGNYYLLDVLHIDLSNAEQAYAIFKFNAYNFIGYDYYGAC